MGSPPTVHGDKYLEVLQYLLRDEEHGGANNRLLGKVKLMKLLYYADFEHYYRHGHSITGDTYRKLDYGPVPNDADWALEELRRREQLKVRYEPVVNYYKYTYELTKQDVAFTCLDSEELGTLAAVVAKWKHHATQDIVTASHGDPPWALVGYGDQVPYHYVFYRDNFAAKTDEEPNLDTIPSRQAS